MSYEAYGGVFATGLQLLDIAAIQDTYGSANTSTRSDDTTYAQGDGLGLYGASASTPFLYTIWDGGGYDKIDASLFDVAAEIDLRPGRFSSIGRKLGGGAWDFDTDATSADPDPGNVAIAYETIIEEAIGTAYDDIFHGLEGQNNKITGGGEDEIGDTIDYSGTTDGVTVNLSTGTAADDGAGGVDTLISIENVAGSDHGDTLTGSSGKNIFFGSNGSDTIDGGGDADTADYTRLKGTVAVTASSSSLSVVKSDGSTSLGTDTLSNIERVVGSAGRDVFTGSMQDEEGYIAFDGGAGADVYQIDLSLDEGIVEIVDLEGYDEIVITNHDNFSVWGEETTEGGTDYFDLVFVDGEVETLRLRFNPNDIDGQESIEILNFGSGNVVKLGDARAFFSENSFQVAAAELQTELYSFSAGGYGGGSGGTGAGGGMLPVIDQNDQITGMHISPFVGSSAVPRKYAEVTWHPMVLTSFWASGFGDASWTMESWYKYLTFQSGITAESIRFNGNGATEDASLVIYLDELEQYITIDYFDEGKTLVGLGVYDKDLHEWVQEDEFFALTGNNGTYYASIDTDEFDWVPAGTYIVTYFLERVGFADGSFIDMMDTLTMKGTDAADSVYGFNTRDDILLGLEGNDYLYGYGEDDILKGGTGRDTLLGGDGDDVYEFSLGDSDNGGESYPDVIGEVIDEGNDSIVFAEGIAPENVLMWTDNGGNLYIRYSAVDYITVYGGTAYLNSFTHANIGAYLEEIVFDDETVWDLTGGLTLRADDEARNVYGTVYADDITGGAGQDYLYGGNGNDILAGGLGRDQVYGGLGNDTYTFTLGDAANGGEGYFDHVVEYIDEGTDTISFGAGIDAEDVRLWTDNSGYLMIRYSADDFIYAYGGPDYVNGFSHANIGAFIEQIVFADTTVWDLTNGLYLHADDNGRQVYGSIGADTMLGGAGTDHLYGGNGADSLTGGLGRDQMYGGLGNDTYFFALGDADNGGESYYDYVIEWIDEGTDTISFDAGIDAEDVRLWTDIGGYLTIRYSAEDFIYAYGGQDYVNGFNHANIGAFIEQIVFDDTTVWDLTGGLYLHADDNGRQVYGSIGADTMLGGAGTDHLYGGNGSDILTGGVGRDQMYGGLGNDTYVFDLGDADNGGESYYDLVAESIDEGTDTIIFGAGIDAEDVRLWTDSGGYLTIRYSADDFIYAYGGTTYANSFSHANIGAFIEQIVFDDTTVWDLTNGLYLHADDNGRQVYGSTGADTMLGGNGSDYLFGGNGTDTLTGGLGRDQMYGGLGNDTYVFELGDADNGGEGYYDLVAESIDEGADTISFGAGIDAEDVRLWTDSGGYLTIRYSADDFIYAYGGTTYANSFSHANIGAFIEQIVFDDTTVWDLTDGLYLHADDNGRYVYGSTGADTIRGGSGADYLLGGDGSDSLDGGEGNDHLYGGGGNDTLYGGDDYDTLYGEAGADTFVFEEATAFNDVDVIQDFNVGDGDILDLTDILSTVYDPLNDAIADFVSFSESGGSTFVSVDRDGTGGTYSMAQIVQLNGVTGLASPDTLETNGNLLAA